LRETEFSEALGKLLTSGGLRDDFATDPTHVANSLCDDPQVRAQLVALKANELEAQAEVLLRKRFDFIQRTYPDFVTRLQSNAWPWFRDYARNQWHEAANDMPGFITFVWAKYPERIDQAEANRLQFALRPGRPVRVHCVNNGIVPPALQVLVRLRDREWKEFFLSLRF